MIFSTTINGKKLNLSISSDKYEVSILNDKKKQTIDCIPINDDTISLLLNGHVYYLTIINESNGYNVMVNHYNNFVEVKNEHEVLEAKLGLNNHITDHSGEIHAQIPGLVSRIDVKLGDNIRVGDTLCILEAMKMENEIKSPKNGTIMNIYVNPDSNVEKGDLLMEIKN